MSKPTKRPTRRPRVKPPPLSRPTRAEVDAQNAQAARRDDDKRPDPLLHNRVISNRK